LALSADVFNSAYIIFGYYNYFPHFLGVTYAFPFLYGPVFYLYARLISTGENKFQPEFFFHFIPFFLVVLYGFLFVYLESIHFKLSLVNNETEDILPLIGMISYFKPVHGIIYMVLIVNLVRRYNSRIKNSYSNIEKINLNWLRHLTVGLSIIWGIVIISYVANAVLSRDPGMDHFIYISASILIYSIGYLSLKQPQLFDKRDKQPADPDFLPEPAVSGSYQKSGLSESEAQSHLNKLINVMQTEKPYLNSELTLRELADHLSVSAHNLSEVLNTRLNQNFYDFINSYRVEEVKRRLAVNESEKYNLLTIAYDSGFNSKTSFNTVFKKQTGTTPSQYRNSFRKLVQPQDK
jgi:AraC-like DNA-binding protein